MLTLHHISSPLSTSRPTKRWSPNIARCFAKAGLLDIGLAKRTTGYYIETHNLLTIATPTGLPEKPAFRNDDSGTYAIYHRADWKVVAKILVEDVIRPAGWSRNADNTFVTLSELRLMALGRMQERKHSAVCTGQRPKCHESQAVQSHGLQKSGECSIASRWAASDAKACS